MHRFFFFSFLLGCGAPAPYEPSQLEFDELERWGTGISVVQSSEAEPGDEPAGEIDSNFTVNFSSGNFTLELSLADGSDTTDTDMTDTDTDMTDTDTTDTDTSDTGLGEVIHSCSGPLTLMFSAGNIQFGQGSCPFNGDATNIIDISFQGSVLTNGSASGFVSSSSPELLFNGAWTGSFLPTIGQGEFSTTVDYQAVSYSLSGSFNVTN